MVEETKDGMDRPLGRKHEVVSILSLSVLFQDVLTAPDLDFAKSTHEPLGADTLDAVSVCTLSKTRAIVLTGIVSATFVQTS